MLVTLETIIIMIIILLQTYIMQRVIKEATANFTLAQDIVSTLNPFVESEKLARIFLAR